MIDRPTGETELWRGRHPDPDLEEAWTIRFEVTEANRRVVEALTAISNGRFGTRGLLDHWRDLIPGSTVAAGIYDDGAVPSLLPGPRWTVVELKELGGTEAIETRSPDRGPPRRTRRPRSRRCRLGHALRVYCAPRPACACRPRASPHHRGRTPATGPGTPRSDSCRGLGCRRCRCRRSRTENHHCQQRPRSDRRHRGRHNHRPEPTSHPS